MGVCASAPDGVEDDQPFNPYKTRQRQGTHIQFVTPLSDDDIKSDDFKANRTPSMLARLDAGCTHKAADAFEIESRKGRFSMALWPGFSFHGRKQCQDNYVTARLTGPTPAHQSFFLFAVFDGHGVTGEQVSQHLVRRFPQIVYQYYQKAKSTDRKHMQQALTRAFIEQQRDLSNSGIDCLLSGSTCTCVLVGESEVHVAWIGDSEAILVRVEEEGCSTRLLTTAHNCEDPNERARISRKGVVRQSVNEAGQPVGPFRVFQRGKNGPGLAVSRSFGDDAAHVAGVISEPDFQSFSIKDNHGYIVIGSDGIWDQMQSEAVASMVVRHTANGDAAEKIALTCAQRWIDKNSGLADDISIIIVQLKEDLPVIRGTEEKQPDAGAAEESGDGDGGDGGGSGSGDGGDGNPYGGDDSEHLGQNAAVDQV